MAATVVFTNEKGRLLREWSESRYVFIAEAVDHKDRAGIPVYRDASVEEKMELLEAAVLNLENALREALWK